MPTLTRGWLFEVERGPSCLYVHPIPQPMSSLETDSDVIEDPAIGFCDAIWELMDQHLSCRVVLELDQVADISPQFVNELVQLHQRVESHAGIVRLCGLCDESREMLAHSDVGRVSELGFATRDEALMAGRAGRPR